MLVQHAPLGSTLPLTEFTTLGYAEEVTFNQEAVRSDVIMWGGQRVGTVLDRVSTTITFTAPPGDTLVWGRGETLDAATWVFTDTDNARLVVIPIGRITQIDHRHRHGDMVTLQAYPDAAGNALYGHPIRTWQETWHDHVVATLEGNHLLAAALLAELGDRSGRCHSPFHWFQIYPHPVAPVIQPAGRIMVS